jgi:lipoate-protein ligase A
MALDEALAAAASPPVPTLRLYRWRPWTLSLGWFQAVTTGDLAPYRAAGFDVTRRATGGGAIFHADELTYCLVLPADDRRIPAETTASYHWIHGAVSSALAAVGVDARPRGSGAAEPGPEPFYCFSRTASIDLVTDGRKLVGSAQRRTATAFLQHGSIPLTPSGTAPEATSVGEILGCDAIDPAPLETAMIAAFAVLLGGPATPSEPTALEMDHARRAVAERFGDAAWVARPLKGRGRAVGPLPPPPPARNEPAPLIVLAATVAPDGLRVDASVGGSRVLLPHDALRAARVDRIATSETRYLTLERDPWDSTFQRSAFEGTSQSPEGERALRMVDDTGTVRLRVEYAPPHPTVVLDAKRFNYRSLGPRRTGRWEDDLRTFAGLLATVSGVAVDLGPLHLPPERFAGDPSEG